MNKNKPPIPHRRNSMRMQGYDYTQPGAYFVTICTQERIPYFGQVIGKKMHLSPAGQMVQQIWDSMPAYYQGVNNDAFIVMPDHIHGIVVLLDQPGHLSLPDVMQRFKSLTTAQYRYGVLHHGWPPFPCRLWHRNYYDRIVHDDQALHHIRAYINANPACYAQKKQRRLAR